MIADIEIRLFALEERGYPVEITVTGEQQLPRGYTSASLPILSTSTNDPAQGYRLWQWLVADTALQIAWARLSAQYPDRRLRLRLDVAAPELHSLPWEQLNDGNSHLAANTNTPFSRYLAGPWRPQLPISNEPVRVLVAIANPNNLTKYGLQPINVEQEWDLINAAATHSRFELIKLTIPVTLARLEAALRQGIHILHFVGHGQMSRKTQNALLYLADETNQAKFVTDTEFVAMLTRMLGGSDNAGNADLRLVYLSSCQTATRHPADAFRGLAPKLVAAGITSVIAMQDLIPVVTAQAFARTFYEQLAGNGQVDVAANCARAHILTANLPGAAIPVLFSRLQDNQLLTAVSERLRLPFEPEMIYIPAGTFLMGDNDVLLTAPQSRVYLPAYRISRYPITNEQFYHFIHTAGRVASKELLWNGNQPPLDQLRPPVIGVTWQEALAYCQWLSNQTGKQYELPGEAHWEKAARGEDGRLYPWGNSWDTDLCNNNLDVITAVDVFPAQSPYGCYDMVGNAREWTTTLWGDSPSKPNERYGYPWANDGRDNLSAPLTIRRIYRGGRGDSPTVYRCSTRGAYLPQRVGPRQQRHGFRVILPYSD
ncbi:MAG: SUMF1/EgtB/PvdO family nonheme iron enzyme [Candidatus Promineifilaceae bacterium]